MRDSSVLKETKKLSTPYQNKEKRLGAYSIQAETTRGNTAVLQMDFLGNGGPVKDIHLYQITKADKVIPFLYETVRECENGSFWITSLQEPTKVLQPHDLLHMDKPYIVFFVLKTTTSQNNALPGSVTATIMLTTTGPLPDNGGTTYSFFGTR